MKKILLCFIILCCFLSETVLAEYIEEDLDYITQKAKSGDSHYQGVLGEIYYRSERGEHDYEKALHWSKLSAEKGNPIGLFNIGFMCVHGEYVPSDNLSCTDLFSKAYPGLKGLAEKGDARAQVALASIYRYGFGVDKDTKKSVIWNRISAEQGFPRAMYIEGIIHYNGMGVEKDYKKAKFWFEKLVEQGDKKAEFQLANMYYNGHGFEKDTEKALKLMREIQTHNRIYEGMKKEGDYIIPNLLPPKYSLIIEEGSCGECCLWSVLQAKGIDATQIEINKAGGNPGRGLHFEELFFALNEYKSDYVDLTRSVHSSDSVKKSKRYHSFLYDDITPRVKKGNPVLIGIKIYPTQKPDWAADHFVLVVGYNEKTNELIYNNFEKRQRINAEQLVSQAENGYSFINKYDWVIAIEFSNFTEDNE